MPYTVAQKHGLRGTPYEGSFSNIEKRMLQRLQDILANTRKLSPEDSWLLQQASLAVEFCRAKKYADSQTQNRAFNRIRDHGEKMPRTKSGAGTDRVFKQDEVQAFGKVIRLGGESLWEKVEEALSHKEATKKH